MARKGEAGLEVSARIGDALNNAYSEAETTFNESSSVDGYQLNDNLRRALEELSQKSGRASAAFTNIVTCLAIKVAMPHIDMRYHQVQIQSQTDKPAGFNFRGVSEQIVAPWLQNRNFEGALSGWQTRTLERPKPYSRSYDENIAHVKDAFLTVFEEIEEKFEMASMALSFLIFQQIVFRESKNIRLSVPKTSDIQLIVGLLRRHFFYEYKASKGASRLPVLALYAIYQVLVDQLERFAKMELRELEAHSAADSQTGAVGDIEVVDPETGEVFEAVEVKHGIALSESMILTASRKIMDKNVDRYYILTTHDSCEPEDGLIVLMARIKELHQCQLIANGLVSSIKYYLRMISDPSLVFEKYVKLLEKDKAVKHEHREAWNRLATSLSG